MPLRMRVHDREPIGAALRRFKKLLERSGVTKELRKRKYYEKPCETRRRAHLRKQNAIRKGNLQVPTDRSARAARLTLPIRTVQRDAAVPGRFLNGARRTTSMKTKAKAPSRDAVLSQEALPAASWLTPPWTLKER